MQGLINNWVYGHPEAVQEIIEIAGGMSPVRRDQVVLEYARRHGLDIHPDRFDRPAGKETARWRKIVTSVLNRRPDLFARWSGKENGRHDKIWMVVH